MLAAGLASTTLATPPAARTEATTSSYAAFRIGVDTDVFDVVSGYPLWAAPSDGTGVAARATAAAAAAAKRIVAGAAARKPESFELAPTGSLDGNDNDDDGLVPTGEVDCDVDDSLPLQITCNNGGLGITVDGEAAAGLADGSGIRADAVVPAATRLAVVAAELPAPDEPARTKGTWPRLASRRA